MDISSPLPAYIAYSVGYFDDRDLIAWVVEYLPTSEYFSDDPHLVELARLNPKQAQSVETAGGLLEAFVAKRWPGFDPRSPKSEFYAKGYFRRRLEEYLAETCTPWQVCRMIDPIEQIFDFPEWLGSMYDDCDWIEPDTQPSECRHLEDAVTQTLKALRAPPRVD